ncbi:uncharacterized protein CEXT_524411 [Caerostris extrusa]|uniref:Uncharacterized protein n=1 Tax=Caerostris extrusa TaxID=172846 RepID=A0AAV4XRA6_CAEEX|nr:uncharacterized protein CEXT_524411 [Caerostris extrusa]
MAASSPLTTAGCANKNKRRRILFRDNGEGGRSKKNYDAKRISEEKSLAIATGGCNSMAEFPRNFSLGYVIFRGSLAERCICRYVFSKGQVETKYYRFLAKNGGHAWLLTQATVIYENGCTKPECVVCLNYVLSTKNKTKLFSLDSLIVGIQGVKMFALPQFVYPSSTKPNKIKYFSLGNLIVVIQCVKMITLTRFVYPSAHKIKKD